MKPIGLDNMTDEEIDAKILAYATANDCVAELCHFVDYDPHIGKVPEHWAPVGMCVGWFARF
jgi:hypothetical protein